MIDLSEPECRFEIMHLVKKDLLGLLTIPAQADLCDWIVDAQLMWKEFAVSLSLSDSSRRAIHCRCRVDMSKEDSTIEVSEVEYNLKHEWNLPTWRIPLLCLNLGEYDGELSKD